MEIKKVAVVGMGTMGSQIGIVCARGGFQTIMVDLSEELIKMGLGSVKSFLNNQVKKGKMTSEETDKVLSLIQATTDLTKALSNATLVIEAVFENIDAKKELFKKMDDLCPNGLDILLNCMGTFHRKLGEKYRPAPLLVKFVKAGRLGQKSGRGVYDYRKKE